MIRLEHVMSDHDRYTPPTDPFAFQPRAPVRSGPAPVTLIASALVLLAAVGAVYFVYQGGVRRHGEPPASVGAPVGEIKTPAPAATNETSGGLVVDRSDEASQVSNAAALTFAPPPETPKPIQAVAGPALRLAEPPPGARPAATTTPAAMAPVENPPAGRAPAKPAGSMTIASLTDAALKDRGDSAPQPVNPVAASGPAGPAVAQIGAFSSAALAADGWQDVARMEAAAMSGKGKRFEPVQRGSETFYRAYVTGFDSRSAADAFCARLRTAGHACFVK